MTVCLLAMHGLCQVPSDKGPSTSDKVTKDQVTKDKGLSDKGLPLDSIYQGTTLKFDFGSAVYLPIRHRGNVQNYELAVNVQLIKKLFPTFEVGYAQSRLYGSATGASQTFKAYGGFMRLGLDYSVLRKYKGENHLLVGARVGTSLQSCEFSNLPRTGNYWQGETVNYPTRFASDTWGEILAGVRVQIYKGLSMGWYLRYKILFTRGKSLDGIVRPAYIVGYGNRNDSLFGWNYYIGWTF